MIRRRTFLGLLAASPLLAKPAFAMSPEIFADGGIAIRGTDPVAYFKTGAVVAGAPEFALMWKGATWHFESPENMEAFEMNAAAYAPQYGGYCAYALSKGALASTDPQAWTIHEGRLYLNFSLDVRQVWSEDIPGNITKADANWPAVLG